MHKSKKMTRTYQGISMLLAVLILAAACSSPSPSPSPEPTVSPLPTPTSAPEPSADEGPEPASDAFVSVLSTPDPDWGTVIGRLVNAADGKAVVGVMAFLEHTTPEHTVPAVLYAPPNTQPRTFSNERGNFVISKVPDGEYAVILFSPPFALQVVTHADGERPKLITVQSGDVVDMGTINVTEFVLP